MEIGQLKTFIAVAEEAHLTRAAERLYTSQPAVSAQLKSLEEELGVALFDRTPKGMRLTAAGEQLLSKARHILQASQDLLSEAQSIQGQVQGELRIGTNSSAEFLKLPQLLQQFHESYPGVTLHLLNSMSADIILDIRKGKLDSGYFFGPCVSADLSVFPLAQTPLALMAPIGWADQFCEADIASLCKMAWVYTTDRCPFFRVSQALFEGHDFSPERVVFVDEEDTIRALVKAGSGIALLRADDADEAEAAGWGCRWKGSLPTLALNIAVQKRRVNEPLIQILLEQHRALWPYLDEWLDRDSGLPGSGSEALENSA